MASDVHQELGLALEQKLRLVDEIAEAERERARLDEELAESDGLLEHARGRPNARMWNLLTYALPTALLCGYAGFLFTNSDWIGFVFASLFAIAAVARGQQEVSRERAFVSKRRRLTLRIEELQPQDEKEEEIEVSAGRGEHVSRR